MGTQRTKGQDPVKTAKTKLLSQHLNGQLYVGVDLPWRWSGEIVGRQNRFFEQILAMAELPQPEAWATILTLSRQYGIPSIWTRARHSLLETNAAALLTALAFSNRKHWPRLVSEFFSAHHLKPGLRGRPRLDPKIAKDVLRGIQIDRLATKLQKGLRATFGAKQSGDDSISDDKLTGTLRRLGYDDREIKAILQSRTPQDAGCRLYYALNRQTENVTLKAIRNSYARYRSSLR